MKRAILFFATVGILAVVTLCVAAASPDPSDDSATIDQLKKEIETLRQRVDSLEKRLEQSQSAAQTRVWPLTPIDPNGAVQPHPIPRNWKRFEFNGMPYYVIPVKNGSPSAPGPEPARTK